MILNWFFKWYIH